jgi:hypothetical protein
MSRRTGTANVADSRPTTPLLIFRSERRLSPGKNSVFLWFPHHGTYFAFPLDRLYEPTERETERTMNLTKSQAAAMLKLGESTEGHEFIEPRVLDKLLSYDLIYWRKANEVDVTPSGEEVYDELAGAAEPKTVESRWVTT